MHKFNLEIEIPDKDYCHKCKFLEVGGWCRVYAMHVDNFIDSETGLTGFSRPEICKQNDKEKTK